MNTSQPTSAATTKLPDRAHRDGHTLSITISDERIGGTVNCPFTATDWEAVNWDDRPVCRRAHDESGAPMPHDTYAAKHCMVSEWYDNVGAEALRVDGEFQITELPVPIGYWFEGYDGDEFYIAPVPAAVSPVADR